MIILAEFPPTKHYPSIEIARRYGHYYIRFSCGVWKRHSFEKVMSMLVQPKAAAKLTEAGRELVEIYKENKPDE